jgi:putative phosphoribosyl transferase
METFANRRDAGRKLASVLPGYANRDDVVVLALPRGGVPVGFEVARALRAPLDVFLVRKLGVPWHPELAMGAIASGGVRVLNDDVVEMLGVSPAEIDAVADDEARELERREHQYRGDRGTAEISGRTVILVDDGLATGASMRAAVLAVRISRPARVVIAVPVASAQTCRELRADESVDDVVCVLSPDDFAAVGHWYDDFAQVSDDDVHALLAREGAMGSPVTARSMRDAIAELDVRVRAGGVHLDATLEAPRGARGLVVFVHGSGSDRFSARNRAVAAHLRTLGLATLLVDLLNLAEQRVDESTTELRFDIERLSARVVGVIDAADRDPRVRGLPIGLFGASTGAAAALVAAARRPSLVRGVVSRGGRPDLAGPALHAVLAPTLFIVGGADFGVLELNEFAFDTLGCTKEFAVVPHATHLFEEPGALDHVARLAGDWFVRTLVAAIGYSPNSTAPSEHLSAGRGLPR